MITITTLISNNNIAVCYHSDPETVSILNKTNPLQTKMFAGYPLIELFDEFTASFNENIAYKDACSHFAPNISNINII